MDRRLLLFNTVSFWRQMEKALIQKHPQTLKSRSKSLTSEGRSFIVFAPFDHPLVVDSMSVCKQRLNPGTRGGLTAAYQASPVVCPPTTNCWERQEMWYSATTSWLQMITCLLQSTVSVFLSLPVTEDRFQNIHLRHRVSCNKAPSLLRFHHQWT